MKIDKGIPIPGYPTGKGKRGYPWKKMEIGDSFLFPSDTQEMSCRHIVMMQNRTYKPKHFICRKTDEGLRCWRDR
jgi:hypothetical protein